MKSLTPKRLGAFDLQRLQPFSVAEKAVLCRPSWLAMQPLRLKALSNDYDTQ